MALPSHDLFTHAITHYGSFALLTFLALGIFGLPIPDETILVISGVFMAKGKLSILLTIPCAFLGSCLGITLSYILGITAGYNFLTHFGRYFKITEEKINSAHQWFEKIGKWTLIFGYFIPGVRHLTGICAGTTKLSYPAFALFAYTGAIIWASTFMTIGYFSLKLL